MERIQKKGAFASPHLREPWFQLLVLKRGLFRLFVRVLGMARECANVAEAHAGSSEKGADLGRTPLDTRQLHHHGLRFGNRLGWMGAKVRFHGGLIAVERAGLPVIVPRFERLHATILIVMQVRDQRLA